MKEHFTMTRRERRGTIVILTLIAVLLAGTLLVRSCRADEVPVADAVEMRDFQSQADSVLQAMPSRQHSASPRHHPSGKKRPHHGKKQSPPQRKMDPVPQF